MVNKKGAMELSIGTIVVLVLAMTMLILGLVLVRSIFKSATESVEQLDNNVKSEISNLFTKESKNVIVKLGSESAARIKPDTQNFKIAIGAKTKSGGLATNLKYTLRLDTEEQGNCIQKNGGDEVKKWFHQKMETPLSFDESEGDTAYGIVQVSIPDGVILCSQKVRIKVTDGATEVGNSFFIIDVIGKGFFG